LDSAITLQVNGGDQINAVANNRPFPLKIHRQFRVNVQPGFDVMGTPPIHPVSDQAGIGRPEDVTTMDRLAAQKPIAVMGP
jgi:hypothetical protein